MKWINKLKKFFSSNKPTKKYYQIHFTAGETGYICAEVTEKPDEDKVMILIMVDDETGRIDIKNWGIRLLWNETGPLLLIDPNVEERDLAGWVEGPIALNPITAQQYYSLFT